MGYHTVARYAHAKDTTLDKMIESFEDEATSSEAYIIGSRKIMKYVLDNYLGSGILTANAIFAKSKIVPDWNMGKGIAAYRWEYIK